MKSLSQYGPVCDALTKEAFEARYSGPFFVHSSRAGGPLQAWQGARTIDNVMVDDPGGRDAAEVQSVFTVSQFAPKGPKIGVGSDRGATVRIPVSSVSRTHVWLHPQGNDWWIEDAESSLGTWVNGEGLDPGARRTLRVGDKVSLGTVDLTFHTAASFYELVRGQPPR